MRYGVQRLTQLYPGKSGVHAIRELGVLEQARAFRKTNERLPAAGRNDLRRFESSACFRHSAELK